MAQLVLRDIQLMTYIMQVLLPDAPPSQKPKQKSKNGQIRRRVCLPVQLLVRVQVFHLDASPQVQLLLQVQLCLPDMPH
jgi:hypothetical protein